MECCQLPHLVSDLTLSIISFFSFLPSFLLLDGLMSVPAFQNKELALPVLYHIIGIIPDTFAYGEYCLQCNCWGTSYLNMSLQVYSCLVPIFIFVMLWVGFEKLNLQTHQVGRRTKGLQTRVRKALFSMCLFMYFISTIHWSLSVARVILIFKDDFLLLSPDHDWLCSLVQRNYPRQCQATFSRSVGYILTVGY